MKTTWRLWILALLPALAGCFLLSPDETARVVDLRVVVDGAGSQKVECNPAQLLLTEDLRAVASLYRSTVGGTPTVKIADFAMEVGPLLPDETRVLTGLVEIPVSPAMETWIYISLLYTGPEGRDPAGQWTGTVLFDIGQQVTVDNLEILYNPVEQTYRGDVQVSAAGETGSAAIPSLLFSGPETNQLTASYRVENVDWDDDPNTAARTILATMDLAFQPIEIFALPPNRELDGNLRLTRLDNLVAGIDVEHRELILGPAGTLGQVNPGEILRGELNLRFEDGSPPREGGRVFLRRSVPLPCD